MHFKKILTIFLAAVLTFSSLTVFCVGAEEPEGLEVEVEAESTASAISSQPMIYNAGEEIKVTLRIGRNTGVTSVMLYIDYDETVLELIEYTAAGLLTEDDSLTAYSTSKGDAYLAFYSENYPNVSCATGVLAEITFQAKAVCAADTFVQVSLFQNNEGLCTLWDENDKKMKPVPFSSENAHFSVHSIDAGEGVVTAPTCQEGGYTTYVCRACKETVIGNLTGATGHTAGEAVEENRVEPTCTEDGSYDSVVYCTVCESEISRETVIIGAVGHTAGEAVEENRVEPTCTEDGSYDSVVYCTVCESEISRETITIGAVGHDLHDVIAKAPTCTEAGWNAYQACRREGCGYSTYQELPASGHRFGEPTVYEPNYHQEGYSVHTCIVCAYEERYDFVPALELLPGDVNGDGKITQTDYLLLKRAILKLSPLPEEFAAAGDFDGDGKTTAADYLLLKRYILFGEVDASSLE
ncbi:MAG: hypothetical protein DBY40_00805 [Clostridiales bacterium]|nr:MAG: hypothetical protein DBY40_00805 [Clostridiales bacterium]